MGQCQYRYNASEQYQRTKPGMAPETHCGARTYPAVDEPEIAAFPRGDGTVQFRATGRYLPRGYDDPHCPAHGGTEEPPPPPVTTDQLADAYDAYMELAKRYQGAIPVTTPNPAQVAHAALDASVQESEAGFNAAVQGSQDALTEVTQHEQ